MSIFGDLTPPAPKPTLTLEPAILRAREADAAHAAKVDGSILALWNLKLDTLDIAKKLQLRESEVANRLAVLRDGRAA